MDFERYVGSSMSRRDRLCVDLICCGISSGVEYVERFPVKESYVE
jgi:hypothetical protein